MPRNLVELRRQRDGSSLNQTSVRHFFDPSPIFRLGRQAIDAVQSVPRTALLAGGVAIVLVLGVMAARATWASLRSERPAGSDPVAVLASRSLAVMPMMLPTATGLDLPPVIERREPVALVAAAGNVSLDAKPSGNPGDRCSADRPTTRQPSGHTTTCRDSRGRFRTVWRHGVYQSTSGRRDPSPAQRTAHGFVRVAAGAGGLSALVVIGHGFDSA